MIEEFKMYRYYKGEANNPFDRENQNTAYMFWFYESIFELNFRQNESSDWFSFFSIQGLHDKFIKILSDEDYERPTRERKAQIFELWLTYLFSEKLYPEYGGENRYKKAYYSLSPL